MKTIRYRSWLFLFFLTAACTNKPQINEKYFDFEGLVEDQVNQLSQRSRVLDKMANLNGEESDSTFLPSMKGWTEELEVFRELELINKPTYRDAYATQDPLDDPKSNLKIRSLVSSSAPVRFVKFYYQEEFPRLKKIEAAIEENNLLFSSHRTLLMEFDEEDGKPLLIRYSMSGRQKMILSDTVRFSVAGNVDW
jgi:hypothetical protein